MSMDTLKSFGRILAITVLSVLFVIYDRDDYSESYFTTGSVSFSNTLAFFRGSDRHNVSGSLFGGASSSDKVRHEEDGLGQGAEHEPDLRNWQVSNTTKEDATTAAPGAQTAGPQKPIAICYSGQSRTFGLDPVWDNHLFMIIEPIRELADVFFVMSIGGDGKGELTEAEQRQCNNLTYIRDEIAMNKFKAKEFYVHDFDAHVRERPPKCREMGWQVGYKLTQCSRLIRQQEQKQGWKYKWIMRMRPDLMFANRLESYDKWPDITQFPEEKAVWTAGYGGCGSKEYVKPIMNANDNWALMTRATMQSYFEEYIKWFTDCRKIPRHPMTFVCAESVMGATMKFHQVKTYKAEVGYFIMRPDLWKPLQQMIDQAKTEGVDLSIRGCYDNPAKCKKHCHQLVPKGDASWVCGFGVMGVLFWQKGTDHHVLDIEKCICAHGARGIKAPPCTPCNDYAVW
eukprot:CAMPEP_0184493220 /NCGR_PEP_ID=MMETSP0113_2-20130426/25434_1 /TAXON_ID=91329 /ORGANISM="Norrisiella sphaerica, Strain BC52" /LENGTH=454 /DNA_ID=CAMNT_0026878411 /DNA_START=113 /DNA_END=1474 /DNA_ORIENTATION=+